MTLVFLCGVATGICLVCALALAKAAGNDPQTIRDENERNRKLW